MGRGGGGGKSAGFVLALAGFDAFARHRRDDAHTLLEVVAERAWPAALPGRCLVCLVQGAYPRMLDTGLCDFGKCSRC
jgi:hypothetical protein